MRIDPQLIHDLKRHEGLRLTAYRDTEGVWTIGYGHTYGVTPGMRITRAEAEDLLVEDASLAVREVSRLVRSWSIQDRVRRGVLSNMCFNLGVLRLSGFRKTLAAVDARDYNLAALEMLDSKWAAQVGGRARELAARMATGRIAPHHVLPSR